jgi:hypothetical protein
MTRKVYNAEAELIVQIHQIRPCRNICPARIDFFPPCIKTRFFFIIFGTSICRDTIKSGNPR